MPHNQAKSKMFRNGMIAFMAVSIALIAVIGGMMVRFVLPPPSLRYNVVPAHTSAQSTLFSPAPPQPPPSAAAFNRRVLSAA